MIFDFEESMNNLKYDIELLCRYCIQGILVIEQNFSSITVDIQSVMTVRSPNLQECFGSHNSSNDERMIQLVTKYDKIKRYFAKIVSSINTYCTDEEKEYMYFKLMKGKSFTDLKKIYKNTNIIKRQMKIYVKILSHNFNYWCPWDKDTSEIEYVKVDGVFTFVKKCKKSHQEKESIKTTRYMKCNEGVYIEEE